MELSELQNLLTDPTKLANKIISLAPTIPHYAYNIEPEDHRVVKDLHHRPWREVDVATGILDATGNMTYRKEHRDVHRIPSATQKQIIEWAVNMNLSGGIELDAVVRDNVESDTVMMAMLKKTWDDNKLDYIARKIDKLKKNYTQCLVVWYTVPAEPGFWDGIAPDNVKFKMRCSVFSPKDGSIIIPIYNQYGDMITCGRKYSVTIDDREVNKLDLYMENELITFTEEAGGWNKISVPLTYGKAPFVFHGQERPEYADVIAKLDRVEEADSDTADENQQSAFPILAATGQILSATGGGTKNTRKSVEMENGADLKYVEAQGSQQSAADERKNMRQDAFDETATPQISMEQIKGSSNIPGVTVEMMFLPATNKAKSNQDGDLGMEWQRHINILKPCMGVLNKAVVESVYMSIKPKFSINLPRNLTEEYANIALLVNAGLMSKATAIKKLAFTDDPEAEYAQILEEQKAAASAAVKEDPAAV